jgi:hypothetical protein
VNDHSHAPHRVRFGTFEVDLATGELWKSGRKLKLTGQPFSVLAILLERPGEVISRELHHPGWYWFVPSFDAYRKGEYKTSLEFAHKANCLASGALNLLSPRAPGNSANKRQRTEPCRLF